MNPSRRLRLAQRGNQWRGRPLLSERRPAFEMRRRSDAPGCDIVCRDLSTGAD